MKDKKTLLAFLLLVFLMAWLIVISLSNKSVTDDQNSKITRLAEENHTLQMQISQIKPINGQDGRTPVLGVDYFNGMDGKQGQKGDTGPQGNPGKNGQNGKSAYQIAVENGFVGSEKDWLSSLKGDKGDPAPELDIECVNGSVSKKYTGDMFWQPTGIKCNE